jgi:hypothetical protein
MVGDLLLVDEYARHTHTGTDTHARHPDLLVTPLEL